MENTPQTEQQKMLAGELYLASDPDLIQGRQRASKLTRLYNNTTEEQLEDRQKILLELFNKIGDNLYITPPFYCDYGCYIKLGNNVYMNSNCIILDCNWVEIGDNVLLAPNVQIYAAYHPIDPELRLSGQELAAPIKIGNNVWIGGGAIICPGVEIGDNTTIGAGSVVVNNIPERVVAVGNPCRVIRTLSLSP
ncbi:maltose O-acetyltransferase [Planktothrix serta PCC 8927]|uniref:Acetyltransferase n=1 Tax=Planktothrix serta PCC 8927 TaxID=671068 RepID=A0A7Z9BQ33_9CYAN|nr:sugar O-acetyltransferase [Planktothrix serta]VXD16001.1 maltose O-acetyltransferase [Planktothrix serta PCC 8927]